MSAFDDIRERLPEAAKDVKVNLQSVVATAGTLTPVQRYGTAVAVALAARRPDLAAAIAELARGEVGEEAIDDARAAASLMAMNNVYYRFRHIVGKPAYEQKAPRLRMQRLAQPKTSKVDFELFALAVSAVNNCEYCVRAHEKVVTEGGLTDEHVHEAVRIAAVVASAATALDALATV